MNTFKTLLKQTPGVQALARYFRIRKLRGRAAEEIFTEFFEANKWRGNESRSGRGSDDDQTALIIKSLPSLFKELGVKTILDIPCGDFHWMKNVDLSDLNYIGADIVADLIAANASFASSSVRFMHLDLIEDKLPQADLIFCRDCLVHLCFADALKALRNACDSEAEFLLTTTFPGRTTNTDILTGEWRAINLQQAPFNFPPPLKLIDEGCTEAEGDFGDKSLGLWKLADIKTCLS